MYCPRCGALLEKDAVSCMSCGAPVDREPPSPFAEDPLAVKARGDRPSTALWVIGFLVPLLGLIFFFRWERERPYRAKSCFHGALAGIIAFAVVMAAALYLFFR